METVLHGDRRVMFWRWLKFSSVGAIGIGVQLTDGMMMEPEASVSALVFHHPACSYFTVSEVGETAVTS